MHLNRRTYGAGPDRSLRTDGSRAGKSPITAYSGGLDAGRGHLESGPTPCQFEFCKVIAKLGGFSSYPAFFASRA